MEYNLLEEAVYKYLLNLTQEENNYYFSVRKKATKGSERDFFIGTKDSNYSLFSFWNIKANTASPTDVIDYVFTFHGQTFHTSLLYICSQKPKDKQQEACLKLGKLLFQKLENTGGQIESNKETNAHYTFSFRLAKNTSNNLDEFIEDLKELIDATKEIIDKCIETVKIEYPSFEASQISVEEFNKFISRLEKRRNKYKDVNQINTLQEISYNMINNNNKPALNQILYGPPGTGKTFSTINLALEICEINTKELSRVEAKKKFDELTQQDRIVFTTFHQSMSYEDFIEGIKPVEPEKDDDQVIYRVEDGIFKKLCVEAAFSIATEGESKQTETVLDFSLAYDELVQEIEEKFNEGLKFELDSKNGGKVLVDSISTNGNIVIKHQGGERTYTVSKLRCSRLHSEIDDLDSVNNIHDHFRAIIGGSNSSAYWSVLNAIQSKLTNITPQQKSDRRYTYDEKKEVIQTLRLEDYKNKSGIPFILVIDEINRGNVSLIFGELITLIEDDKRLGKNEAIQVNLPYSKKEKFGVPSNLFIIGTMNTADRSVEALDTALRRRFSFTEMPPLYDIDEEKATLQYTYAGVVGSKLLETINNRIEKLLDRDHLIGHSYFLMAKGEDAEAKLIDSFYRNIIPLLQEYFYGDYAKIGAVLGSGFVFKNQEDSVTFGDGFNEEEYSDKDIYQIIDYRVANNPLVKTDMSFEKAIQKLMNTPKEKASEPGE